LPGVAGFCIVSVVNQSGKKRPERAQPAAQPISPAATVILPSDEALPFPVRHPQLARLILVAVWLYVAALWLLALDQTFNWGIFGPKVPPT
jgi:hypothetical protein